MHLATATMSSSKEPDELLRLRSQLADKDEEIRILRKDLQIAKDDSAIKEASIKELSAVIARNLARVKSETGYYAKQLAMPAQEPTGE